MKIPSPDELKARPPTDEEIRSAHRAQQRVLDNIAYARNIIEFEDMRVHRAWTLNFLDDWRQAGWHVFNNEPQRFVLISPDKPASRWHGNKILIKDDK